MSEENAFSAEEEAWIQAQRARAAKRKKKSRGDDNDGAVNINSLMDIMVIILVFLLKNYGDEPIKVVGKDLKAPTSSTQLTPEDMTTITITQKSILVNSTEAATLTDGQVDKSLKKSGAAGLEIIPVFDELNEAINRKKREMKLIGDQYDPVVTIIADQSTPYRLLTEVMYTAGQAELSKFKFAVVKGDRKEFATD